MKEGIFLGASTSLLFRNGLWKAHRPHADGFKELALPHFWNSFCPSMHSLSQTVTPNLLVEGRALQTPHTRSCLHHSRWICAEPFFLGSFYTAGMGFQGKAVDHRPTEQALPWPALWRAAGAVWGVLSGVAVQLQRVIAVRQLEAVVSLGTASVLGWGGGRPAARAWRCR